MIDRLADLRAAEQRAAATPADAQVPSLRSALLSAEDSETPVPSTEVSSARSRSSADPACGALPRAASKAVQVFLAELEAIQQGPLKTLEAKLQEASALYPQALGATNARAEQRALAGVTACAQVVSSAASEASTRLKGLSSKQKSGELSAVGSTEAHLVEQGFFRVSLRLRAALSKYFQAQKTFKQEMEAKVRRQLQLAFPETDIERLEEVAAGKRSAAAAIQESVSLQRGDEAPTTVLQADCSEELANLARLVEDLAQAFKDVDTLVSAQGESLTLLESDLAGTRENTQGAVEALGSVEQTNRCLCSCCLVFSSVFGSSLVVLLLLMWYLRPK